MDEIFVQRYKNRKGVLMAQVIGDADQFREAGIDLQFADEHQPGRFNVRGTQEEMEEVISAAVEFNEGLDDGEPETMREWMNLDPDQTAVFIEALDSHKRVKPFTAAVLASWLGMKSSEAKKVVAMMFRDKWVDSNGKLLNRARKECERWEELQAALR